MSKLAEWVGRVLLPWGIWGLAGAAVLDSSFVPFPSGVDLWMISLCFGNPANAWLYVLVAAVGSVIGGCILYAVFRKGEERLTEHKASHQKILMIRAKIERSGFWAIVIGSLLPPPAPFKLFIIAAGLLEYPWGKFISALLVGRVIRYSLEAYLAVRYGRKVWEILLRAGPWAFAAGVLTLGVMYFLFKSRRPASKTIT